MYNSLTKVIYFITLTVVDWVDVFTRPIYKHIVIDSLRYCQENKRLRIYAWVMMSNHLHLLVDVNDEMSYEQERLELSNIIRDFKKFTSKKLVNSIEDNVQESRKDWMMNRFWYAGANDKKIKNNRFWQEGYCPEVWVYYVPRHIAIRKSCLPMSHFRCLCRLTGESIRKNNKLYNLKNRNCYEYSVCST